MSQMPPPPDQSWSPGQPPDQSMPPGPSMPMGPGVREAPGATAGLVLGICSIVGLRLGAIATLGGCGYFALVVVAILGGAASGAR